MSVTTKDIGNTQ